MRKILLAAALLAGCTHDKASHHEVTPISVEVAADQIGNGQAIAVDANGVATRKHMGILPGALQLSDSESYDLAELPKDKQVRLIFYCANTTCSASHQAAEKAANAGYASVEVMTDGIAGWVKAGKKTEQI